jgi:hypothetical protein
VLKPGKMPSFHYHVRGVCRATDPGFLPARAHRSGVAVPYALLAQANPSCRRLPDDRHPSAAPTKALARAHTVCRPDQKPPCAACEQEAMHPKPPPPVPLHPMPPTTRRPRTVDTSRHFCPHATCDYQGWVGLQPCSETSHVGRSRRRFHERQAKLRGSFAQIGEVARPGPLFIVLRA